MDLDIEIQLSGKDYLVENTLWNGKIINKTIDICYLILYIRGMCNLKK